MEERDEEGVWIELVEQWMAANNDEYGEFERIPEAERLHPARKLCGFLKLASLMRDPSAFPIDAVHDEIYLATPEELRRDVTEADIVYLIRCTVRWNSDGYFAMYT